MSGKDLMKKIARLLYAVLFKYCYITGLFTLSVIGSTGSVTYMGIRRMERGIAAHFSVFSYWRRRFLQALRLKLERVYLLHSKAKVTWRAGWQQLRGGRVRDGMVLISRAATGFLAQFWPFIKTLINWSLPLLAAGFLYRTVMNQSQIQFILKVEYGTPQTGYEELGYISDESVYDNAVSEVLTKMKGVETQTPIDFSAKFTLVPVGENVNITLEDRYTLSDKIISGSGGDITEGYGLYIDGEFVDAVREKDSLLDLLALMLDQHKTGDPTEKISFIKNVALRKGLYPSEKISNLSQINKKINREVKGEYTYIVEEGDSPSYIAEKFDIPQAQLVALNPGILDKLLIGDEVIISKAEPYLSVKTEKIESYTETIPYSTERIEDASLLKGQTTTIREGTDGLANVRARVTYVNDMETERDVLSRSVITEPISAQVKVGTKLFLQNYGASSSASSGTVSSNFIWPVPGMTYISNYFYGNTYYRYYHGALDFASNYGTPIFASAPGRVIYSAYTSYGYGRYIIIDHGGGVQTLYAHNSMNVVHYGDVVEQGQLIGYVGSTGNSTGNHCHFEIRVGGVKQDPLNYLP